MDMIARDALDRVEPVDDGVAEGGCDSHVVVSSNGLVTVRGFEAHRRGY
jgi:hypothetical protein